MFIRLHGPPEQILYHIRPAAVQYSWISKFNDNNFESSWGKSGYIHGSFVYRRSIPNVFLSNLSLCWNVGDEPHSSAVRINSNNCCFQGRQYLHSSDRRFLIF